MRSPARRPIGRLLYRPLDLREFYQRLHRSIGGAGPRGLAWDMELPRTDLDEDAFRIDYLWSEIASKYDPCDRESSTERSRVAIELFRESEEGCRSTNERLSEFSYRAAPMKWGHTLDAVLFTASRKIGGLLGPFDWQECDTHMSFGPGASYSVPRRDAHLWSKFETNLDVNPNAIPVALAVLAGRPTWCRALIEAGGCVVPNPKNRITTVPKNYKRDRVIAIEPLMGIYLQKGIGGVLRSRLRRAGINLNDQSPNQLGALVGSLDGSLATVDLKAASDTISIGIVQQLLPPDWLLALEQCRSPFGVLDSGEKILYRKFSSMGNGFTFELETLLFWGICSAVLELCGAKDRRLLVYGDDIVCPSESVEFILESLARAGFTPNAKKTHLDGPFRESCGKHFLGGHDVTPFYIRRPIKSAGDIFLLHNNLMRWLRRGYVCDSSYRRDYPEIQTLLRWIRSHVPDAEKQTICDGYGDNAFVGSFDEVCPRVLLWGDGHSHEHYALRCWPEKVTSRVPSGEGMLTASLSLADTSLLSESQALARTRDEYGRVRRMFAGNRVRKTLRIPLCGWNEMGPWVQP